MALYFLAQNNTASKIAVKPEHFHIVNVSTFITGLYFSLIRDSLISKHSLPFTHVHVFNFRPHKSAGPQSGWGSLTALERG